MGNGFPLAAVATTKEIASSLGSKLTYSTYVANPIAMAAGREDIKDSQQGYQPKHTQSGLSSRQIMGYHPSFLASTS